MMQKRWSDSWEMPRKKKRVCVSKSMTEVPTIFIEEDDVVDNSVEPDPVNNVSVQNYC